MASSAFLNSSASSSLVSTVVHSLGGCKVTITSLSSMDMGSVGISAAPIRVTTCFTSGNFIRIRSISVIVSTVLVNVVPVFNTGCMTKSPSSSVGTNSEPIVENSQTAATRIKPAVERTALVWVKAQLMVGSYSLFRKLISRTDTFLGPGASDLRKSEETTGT